MLTGRMPFGDVVRERVLDRQAREHPIPPTVIRPELNLVGCPADGPPNDRQAVAKVASRSRAPTRSCARCPESASGTPPDA
jgi:hypothetical protein